MTNPHTPDRRVYLTDAELHAIFNEPLDPGDPPRGRYDGLVWLGILTTGVAVFVAVVWGFYRLLTSPS